MLETLTIITLSVLYLIFFRPGKTPPLENPLVIQRVGQYHITLAPKLNLAQPLIEDIAKRLVAIGDSAPDSATLCFEVRDKEVAAHGQDSYLLAITQRNGLLYFQAIASKAPEQKTRAEEMLAFADTVLATGPMTGSADAAQRIISAAHEAAQQRGAAIFKL